MDGGLLKLFLGLLQSFTSSKPAVMQLPAALQPQVCRLILQGTYPDAHGLNTAPSLGDRGPDFNPFGSEKLSSRLPFVLGDLSLPMSV